MRVTLKGQGQSDPWLTIEGANDAAFRARLTEFLDVDPGEFDDYTTAELIALAAARYVGALNKQPGISQQRDNKSAQPPAAQPAASSPFPTSPGPRPGLSSSLTPDSNGVYWINLPYQRNAALGAKQREVAKSLGAQFRKDEAPDPKNPWQVHPQWVSEENMQRLLQLHETKFAEVK